MEFFLQSCRFQPQLWLFLYSLLETMITMAHIEKKYKIPEAVNFLFEIIPFLIQ